MRSFLILLFLLVSAGILYANDDVWIEPGVGIGVMRIGDNMDAVIEKLGRPQKTSGNNFWESLDYPDWHIEVSNTISLIRTLEKGHKPSGKEPVTVEEITTYSSKAKTRGNITIGSTLKDVLTVFGDTMSKSVSTSKYVTCAEMLAAKLPESPPSGVREDDFNGYIFFIHYYDGITFFFKVDNQIPKVFAISVGERMECEAKDYKQN